MPQLDFVWWVINFILIWVCLLTVLSILLNNKEEIEVSESSSTNINKETTTWEWV
uniref:ATP synthase complex subunit 8 n=1 Tax=Temnopleurus toreumaticus TaxID=161058 RepID=A0A1L6Z744_9ECHN|nr:ATP synthase F0 subunit 8 [Temnopleurus toreumaticus]APT42102.1 ATP synthase F0 subunit 8 [Temnopleurus toreumaticus]